MCGGRVTGRKNVLGSVVRPAKTTTFSGAPAPLRYHRSARHEPTYTSWTSPSRKSNRCLRIGNESQHEKAMFLHICDGEIVMYTDYLVSERVSSNSQPWFDHLNTPRRLRTRSNATTIEVRVLHSSTHRLADQQQAPTNLVQFTMSLTAAQCSMSRSHQRPKMCSQPCCR